jgi:hypothetical protein
MSWIKMRADLQTHPKVVRISSALKADTLRTIGGLHATWSIFDTHSEDGNLAGYTCSALDELIGWPGFAKALESVGWLETLSDGLFLPRFLEHNGQSAKRRAEDSVRKMSARKADIFRKICGPEKEKEKEKEIQQHHAPGGAGGPDLSVSFPEGWTDTLDGDPPRGLPEFMGDSIVGWKPDARVLCETASSVRELRRLVEIDGRDPDRVRALLIWLFGGGYQPRGDFDWRPNVTSGESLRRAWDKLDTLYKSQRDANGHGEP